MTFGHTPLDVLYMRYWQGDQRRRQLTSFKSDIIPTALASLTHKNPTRALSRTHQYSRRKGYSCLWPRQHNVFTKKTQYYVLPTTPSNRPSTSENRMKTNRKRENKRKKERQRN